MCFTAVVTDLVWKNTTTSDINCSSLNCTRLNLAWAFLKAFTTDLIVGVKKQKLVLPNSETFQFVYDFLQDSTLMVIYLTFILYSVPIRWYHWRSWFHSLQLWQLLYLEAVFYPEMTLYNLFCMFFWNIIKENTTKCHFFFSVWPEIDYT